MALSIGVELSYLNEQEQYDLLKAQVCHGRDFQGFWGQRSFCYSKDM